MAETLTLSDAYGSINLATADGSTGLTVLYGGGVPSRAVDPDERVIDTYSCKVTATSDDNLAAQLIALNRILENAARYDRDSTEENEVWLTDQLAAETNTRRTLVLGGSWTFDSNPHSVPTSNEHTAFITLAIKHMAAYEQSSFLTALGSGVSVFGGSISLSALALGDMPSGGYTIFSGYTGTIETIWAGFRSIRKHAVAAEGDIASDHFVPIWEAELGTPGTNTAAVSTYNSTSTGSGGNKSLLVSFADALWTERVVVTALQTSGSYALRQTGRFLVLGRMRLDTGTDLIQVRLRSGWHSSTISSQYKTLDPVTISGTDFRYYELGTVKFPPSNNMIKNFTASTMNNAALSLLAARLIGTTSKLIIDHFALVPIDEGFVKLSGLNFVDGTNQASVGALSKNVPLSGFYEGSSGGFSGAVPTSQQNYFVPFNISSLYVFGQRLNNSVIGDQVEVLVVSLPRYYSLRGNDATIT